MAVCGVVPFGNKSTMIWDSLLQYKDYYGYLWDVFHGNAGIEYSTGKALGGRMIGIVAYYLSSPLNLFIVFFSKAQIPQFMAFMILLRIGLCGITGYIYVDKRFKISVILYLYYQCYMHLWNIMCIIVETLCGLMELLFCH